MELGYVKVRGDKENICIYLTILLSPWVGLEITKQLEMVEETEKYFP